MNSWQSEMVQRCRFLPRMRHRHVTGKQNLFVGKYLKLLAADHSSFKHPAAEKEVMIWLVRWGCGGVWGGTEGTQRAAQQL